MLEDTGYFHPDVLHQGFLRVFCGMWYKTLFMLAQAYDDNSYKGPLSDYVRSRGEKTTLAALVSFLEAHRLPVNRAPGGNLKLRQPDITRACVTVLKTPKPEFDATVFSHRFLALGLDVSVIFPPATAWLVSHAQPLFRFLLDVYYEEYFPTEVGDGSGSIDCDELASLVDRASFELEKIIDVLRPPLRRSGGRFWPWLG